MLTAYLGGDYAGNTYSNDGCPGSCIGASPVMAPHVRVKFLMAGRHTDLVNDHPEAFTEAYWEFAAVRVYQ